jgi:hypothetical protein
MLADNENLLQFSWKQISTYIVPQILSVSDKQAYQIFALDLIENKSSNTLWTHKPSAWKEFSRWTNLYLQKAAIILLMNSSILYVLPSDATSLKDQTSRKPLLQKIKELLIVKFLGYD